MDLRNLDGAVKPGLAEVVHVSLAVRLSFGELPQVLLSGFAVRAGVHQQSHASAALDRALPFVIPYRPCIDEYATDWPRSFLMLQYS